MGPRSEIGEGVRIDMVKLDKRFRETASHDVSEEAVIKNWEHFLKLVKKEVI